MYIIDKILSKFSLISISDLLNGLILYCIIYTIFCFLGIIYNLLSLYFSYFKYGWAKYREGYISYEKWAYDQLNFQTSIFSFPYIYCIIIIYLNLCDFYTSILLLSTLYIFLSTTYNIAFYFLRIHIENRLLVCDSNPSVRRLAGTVGELIKQSELQNIQIQKLSENLIRWTHALNHLSESINQLNDHHRTQSAALKLAVKSIHDLHVYLLDR